MSTNRFAKRHNDLINAALYAAETGQLDLELTLMRAARESHALLETLTPDAEALGYNMDNGIEGFYPWLIQHSAELLHHPKVVEFYKLDQTKYLVA